jgi:hypothetical protein
MSAHNFAGFLQLPLFAALCLLAPALCAQEDARSNFIGASLSTAFDSNVTRAPEGGGAQGSGIETASLLAGFDHTYGRENLSASAQLGRVLYRQMAPYDYTSEDVRLRLKSSLPANIETDFKVTRTQQLTPLADLTTIRRNVFIQNLVDGSATFPVGALEWRALIGADALQVRNSNDIDRLTDMNMAEVTGGLRYQSGSENNVDFVFRTQHASYPDGAQTVFATGAYQDRAADLRTKWRISGASALEGRIGYIQRRYDNLVALDFAGPAYDLTYRWTPGAKTTLTLFALRATGAPGDSNYLAAVAHTYRVSPAYLLSEYIHLDAHYEWTGLHYFGDTILQAPGQTTQIARIDAVNNAGISAVWRARRWLNVTIEAHREQRNSNIAIWDYTDRVATLTLASKF